MDDLEKLTNSIEVLNEMGVNTFLWAGTLLGAHREGDFISGDSDIDIAYLSYKETPKEVMAETIDIYNKLREKNLLADYFDQNWQKHKGGNISTAFGQAHLLSEYPYIDLFTVWNFKGETWDPWYGPMGFTLQEGGTATIKGKEFPVPKNTEKILEFLYGDWRTPRKEKGTKYHKFGCQLRHCCGVV